jgi:hypothetical protein
MPVSVLGCILTHLVHVTLYTPPSRKLHHTHAYVLAIHKHIAPYIHTTCLIQKDLMCSARTRFALYPRLLRTNTLDLESTYRTCFIQSTCLISSTCLTCRHSRERHAYVHAHTILTRNQLYHEHACWISRLHAHGTHVHRDVLMVAT